MLPLPTTSPTMSLATRRAATRPPALNLPTGPGGLHVIVDNPEVKTPVRNTMPITPLPGSFDNAMTPDTAEFPNKLTWPIREWTEDEDCIIETYLAKPPRPVSQQYPPGELPPPVVIAEIARQILRYEIPKQGGWNRPYEETRARVFYIARQESMRQVGGYLHRRTPSDPKALDDRPEITAEVNLVRQIDSVAEELVIPEFSHSLRLSDDTLHNTNGNGNSTRVSKPLASPMEMHFTLPGDETPKASQAQPQQAQLFPISTGLSAAANRPPSLLSRGRSFTSDDLLLDDANTKGDAVHNDSDISEESDQTSSLMSSGLQHSTSSSISNITNSPPSSLSSQSIAGDIDVDVEAEPFTPLNQTSFPLSVHEASAMHSQSTTPKVTVESSTPIAAPQSIASQAKTKQINPYLEQASTPQQDAPGSASQPGRKTVHERTQDGPEQSMMEQTDRRDKRQKVISPSHGRGQSTSSNSGITNLNDVFGSAL